jgi:hypothetical protein
MVWMPSLVFVVLALAAHLLDPELWGLPLSYSRDGQAAVVGYAAFAALVVTCWGYAGVYLFTPAVRRFAFGPLVAAILLTAVAVSPTESTFHDGVTVWMLVWSVVFFAVRLLDRWPRQAGAYVVVVVVASGGAVLIVGPAWGQKVLVGLLVVAMNVDVWMVRRVTMPQL